MTRNGLGFNVSDPQYVKIGDAVWPKRVGQMYLTFKIVREKHTKCKYTGSTWITHHPLFIGRNEQYIEGKISEAHEYPTKGFKFRPGIHCCYAPHAPHIKLDAKNETRTWMMGYALKCEAQSRPMSQGGMWFIAGQWLPLTTLTPAEADLILGSYYWNYLYESHPQVYGRKK